MPLNVANTVTITAKTSLANVTTVSANVLSNAASSNQIYKINNILLSNYSATAQTASIIINRNGVGTFYVINAASVPATSMLAVLGKDTQIYLEEGDTLQVLSSVNSAIHMTTGYELLS